MSEKVKYSLFYILFIVLTTFFIFFCSSWLINIFYGQVIDNFVLASVMFCVGLIVITNSIYFSCLEYFIEKGFDML